MSIQFSQVIPTQSKSIGSIFPANSLDLSNERSSTVLVVDDFREWTSAPDKITMSA
jgi:hypothetical protein